MKQSLLLLALLPAFAHAQAILAPGNPVFGVRNDGTNILVATTGTTAAANNYPAAEAPQNAIDGVGQKYLNFAETNTGLMVSPFGGPSIVGSIQVWTANDAIERDPASFALYGTNLALSGAGMLLSNFTLIAQGGLTLPDGRNLGGSTSLNAANSQTVGFANSSAYQNYLILFPTVKNSSTANSMQIGEVQLFAGSSTNVPDTGPGLILSALLLSGLCTFRSFLARRQ